MRLSPERLAQLAVRRARSVYCVMLTAEIISRRGLVESDHECAKCAVSHGDERSQNDLAH
jgi:hypothetical protein